MGHPAHLAVEVGSWFPRSENPDLGLPAVDSLAMLSSLLPFCAGE